jgi:hypothetical protein
MYNDQFHARGEEWPVFRTGIGEAPTLSAVYVSVHPWRAERLSNGQEHFVNDDLAVTEELRSKHAELVRPHRVDVRSFRDSCGPPLQGGVRETEAISVVATSLVGGRAHLTRYLDSSGLASACTLVEHGADLVDAVRVLGVGVVVVFFDQEAKAQERFEISMSALEAGHRDPLTVTGVGHGPL